MEIDSADDLVVNPIDEDVDENLESVNRTKKKAVTKAAVAKKILKKKIVPNKKTTFDDEGQVCVFIIIYRMYVRILFARVEYRYSARR